MLVAAAGLFLLSACEKNGFSYENATDNEDVQYTLLDTFSIQMRTVQLDSIPTSGTATALIGGYNDPVFGRIEAGTYFKVSMPADREIDVRAVYDSIELIMRPNGSWYGDTLLPQQIRVYKLAQELALPDEYYMLFSHQNFPVESMPWADTAITMRPLLGEALHIRMSDVKGKQLFDMMRDKALEFSTDDHFAEFFKEWPSAGTTTSRSSAFMPWIPAFISACTITSPPTRSKKISRFQNVEFRAAVQ